jgi:hypothetical protein
VIVFTNGEQYDGSPRASLDTGELEDLTRRAVDEVERNVPLSQP